MPRLKPNEIICEKRYTVNEKEIHVSVTPYSSDDMSWFKNMIQVLCTSGWSISSTSFRQEEWSEVLRTRDISRARWKVDDIDLNGEFLSLSQMALVQLIHDINEMRLSGEMSALNLGSE
jgi:hypothetical protein